MAKIRSIGIKELIDCLNSELMHKSAADASFCLDKVEMEIAFTVERRLNGELDFHVVERGLADAGAPVQTVKVTLSAAEQYNNLPEQLFDRHHEVVYK